MPVTCKDAEGKPCETTMGVLLPGTIMEYLISECGLSLSDQLVQKYWSHLEAMQDEWALSTSLFRHNAGSSVWPLGFYGDEAVVGLQGNPQLKVLGLWMSVVLFRPRATRLSRYLLFVIESDNVMSLEQTIFPVLQCITDSYNQLAETGACGRRCLVAEIRGDQLFHRFIFKHKSWWRKLTLCFRCKAQADSGPLGYTNPECRWRGTMRDTNQFIREELPQDSLCALILFENRIEQINIDFCKAWLS